MSFLPVIGLISLVLISAVGSTCLYSDLQQCEASSPFDDIDDIDDLFTVAGEDLTYFCSNYSTYASCLEEAGCDDIIAIIADNDYTGANLLCSSSLEYYLADHQPCLAGILQRYDFEDCDEENSIRTQVATSLSSFCKTLDLYLECKLDLVEDACGADTADWYERLIENSNEPLKELYSCDGSGSGAESRFSVNLQVLAALIVAVLLL